ncbi:Nucleotidyltransferase domain-containing protein [Halobacillus alkaliphilus]|uniref:Nucleotidyltransferase domain-containing protein n=1 Tax=Halobacillus alkaliphilus TaxID=396056 RepID=A0A1I2LPM2_9BACI|nr:nucleotidyltransferase domain-containing protein [Halobacillus alkaliphilus]SFF79357.1 Nucleotidyltransferase domain-containing protein [Halobacillus alkaliphilus]
MKRDAFHTARAFIDSYFPDCQSAVLSGSVVRGEETPSSDLDIVVIDREPFRQSYYYCKWPVEVFVHNKDSLEDALFIETQHGIPLMTRLCAEGMVIKGGREAEKMIEEAKKSLIEGPCALPLNKLNELRYAISDNLDDLEGSERPEEDIYSVSSLTESLHQFILRSNQKWAGEGKWMYRSLRDYDEALAVRLTECLQSFYTRQEKGELIRFVDEILAPHGGRLFHDYYARF